MKKQHIIYFVVGIVALTIAVSAFYYFVVFLPDQMRQETQRQQQMESQGFLFSMKQKCQNIGTKLYEEDARDLGKNELLVPQFAYNAKLNTCLYFSGYVQNNSFQKWIKDSLTGQEILSFMTVDNKSFENTRFCDTCVSNEEFEKQKKELFQ